MTEKKILIADENGFSRVCLAILEFEGYRAEIISDLLDWLPLSDNREFGLIITSYPYCSPFFNKLKEMNIPAIILLDHINKDIMKVATGFYNSCFMIKPLDYQKFRAIVRQVYLGDFNYAGGYKIV